MNIAHIVFFVAAWFAIATVAGIVIGKFIAFGSDVRDIYNRDGWE